MNIETLPCIDCITFPICLSKYVQYKNDPIMPENFNIRIAISLTRKCCLLDDYIFVTSGHGLAPVKSIKSNEVELHNYFRSHMYGY